jgi:hypothetical protein
MTALACSGTMGRYKLETGMKKMQFLARVNDGGASATDREAQRPSEQKLKSIADPNYGARQDIEMVHVFFPRRLRYLRANHPKR